MIFFLLLILELSKEQNLIKLNSISEIVLTINGTGDQNILTQNSSCNYESTVFESLPSQIFINGDLQNYTGFIVYNLIRPVNIIRLKWNYTFTNCNTMFSSLNNITKIDFSAFDTSNVIDMRCMFRGCTSLQSLNLNNLNTSLVNNMVGMFKNCENLKTIELTNFDTSSVINMYGMFSYCYSLVSLNLSNFDTSKVINMSALFYRCDSLKRLVLKNNKTNNASFIDMFHTNTTLVYCIKETSSNLFQPLSRFQINCSDYCFENYQSKLIVSKSKCIDDCQYDQDYKYEYNKICYNKCPDGTKNSLNNNYLCEEENLICENYYNFSQTECLDKIPEGYYLNDSIFKTIDKCNIKCKNCSSESIKNNLCITCNNNNGYYQKFNDSLDNNSFINCYNESMDGYALKDNIYMPCFETCKECEEIGNYTNNKCTLCKEGYKFLNDSNINTNCYQICDYHYYFDLDNNYKCSLNDSCPDSYKLIKFKNKCINNCSLDSIYKYEYNNECYESCPNGTNHSNNNEYLCESNYYNNQTGCLNEIPDGYYLNDSIFKTIDKCNIKCKNCSSESIKNNLCITCNNNNGYYQKFNDSLDNNSFINCYNESMDGYALKDNIYMPCFETCKECEEIGNYTNNKCTLCKEGYTLLNDPYNNTNCYKICDYYYYFDSLNQYNNYQFTNNKSCPNNYNKLITGINKCTNNCFNEIKYKYEYNNTCLEKCPKGTSENNDNLCEKLEEEECQKESPYISNINNKCLEECKAIDLFTNICKINNNGPELQNKVILNIKNELKNGDLDTLLANLINGGPDLIFRDNNTIYQITSTDNKNNNKNDNISIIKLGECENILRDQYKISKNETLLILKLDIFEEGSLTPIVEYELYDSKENHQQLNLDYCKDTKINIFVSVILETDERFKYNASSEYYNDVCYAYTTKNNTDIILNDRINEYNNNNMSLCEVNCKYGGYDEDAKRAICECEVKYKIPLMSEIIINKNKFAKLSNIKNIINLNIMKCHNVVFSIEGLIKNICSYFLLSMIFINICSFLGFFINGYMSLWNIMNKIEYFKKKKLHTNESKKKIMKKNKSEIMKKNKNEIMNKNKNKKKSIISHNMELNKRKKINRFGLKNGLINVMNVFNGKKAKNNDNKKKRKTKNPPIKKRNKKNRKNINNIETDENKKENNSFSKFVLNKTKKNKRKNTNKPPLKVNLALNSVNNDANQTLKLNDYEMNQLDYEMALIIDKRNYFQYYFALLRRKHSLIFTFYTYDDYNSRMIKICLFFFSFSFYFTINALFFRDSTMHKIYEDFGEYDFIYQIPQIIYSTLISSFVKIIVTYLSLYERNVLNFKKKSSNMNKNINTVFKCIKIKTFLFFVLTFLFMLLFWYYLACFGAVYKNTQLHLIKDTLFSFGLPLIYPLLLCLFPGIFRIPALKNKERNKECLYKFSLFVQTII